MLWGRSRQPTKLGGVVAVILGACFGIGGIVLSMHALSTQTDYEFLRDHGKRVAGEVIATRIKYGTSRRSTTKYYHLTVRFSHAGGLVVKEIEVPEGPFARFQHVNASQAAPCTVLFDPERADHFTIDEAVSEQISGRSTAYWTTLLLGLAIGAFCVFTGIHTYKKAVAIEDANRVAYAAGPWPPHGFGTPDSQRQPPPYRPMQQRAHPPQTQGARRPN